MHFAGGLVVVALLGLGMAALVVDTFRPSIRDATRKSGGEGKQETRELRQARQALLFLVGFAVLFMTLLWVGTGLRR